MSNRLKELREKRGVAVTEMRELIAKAETEKRDMSAEELVKHKAAFDKVEALRAQIDAEQRTLDAERLAVEQQDKTEQERRDADKGKPGEKDVRAMTAFRGYLKSGVVAGEGAEELRALQAGSDTEGGNLRPPQQFVTELLKNVDNVTFIRARATKYQVVGPESLGVPTLDTDLDDADWTTELATGNEDTAMRTGKRELRPHPMAKLIKVSKKLLRSSALPIEAIIRQRLEYKFGVTGEKGYIIGNGDKKALGVFTASNDGIPTTRDVSVGNTATAMTFDGLIEAKYSVKSQYWANSDWLFHRDGVKNLTKIKDGEGQYIWRMSVSAGEPDTLLGRPLMISEYVPNTFTTGLYVGLFGDFSYYWIADALDLTVQRVTELFALTNQDGFIGRLETDGMPVLAEAFARVKLA